MPRTHDNTGRTRKQSGDIMVAPLQTVTRPYRRNKITGQFAARLIEMLESDAYRVLSLSAHRLLARLEIELAHHGGRDNGRLPVTFDDFEKYGIDRHAVALAMREVEALGFIEVTERGRAGNAEFRTPNKFRITYRPAGSAGATDEWRKIKTIEEAKSIALAAREPITRERPTNGTAKNQKPVGENTNFGAGIPHRKAQGPSAGKHHYSQSGEPPTTLDISGRKLVPITDEAGGRTRPQRASNRSDQPLHKVRSRYG